MARPSTYDAKFHVPWCISLCRRGCTAEEVAEAFGIAKKTLYEWRKKYPELRNALNETRQAADGMVEKSLFERALGYTVTEKRTILSTDKGSAAPAKVEIIEKEVPPDVTACIFWLKNRQPKEWRDRQNIAFDDDKPVINVSVPMLNAKGK